MEEDRIVMMSSKGYESIVNSSDGKNLYWTDDINAELPIKVKTSGPGSIPPVTIPEHFRYIVGKYRDRQSLLI